MKRLSIFTGDLRPMWSPRISIKIDTYEKSKKYLHPPGLSPEFTEYFYIADNFLDRKSCEDLISEFSLQATNPVGVSGYGTIEEAEIGSFRANAWSVSLADQLSAEFSVLLADEAELKSESHSSGSVFLNLRNERIRMPVDKHTYSLLGPTPFMRFMKYPSGGRHVPHYDAPYVNIQESYITLMSWIIYLNTPRGDGGEFQFVDDGQWELSPLIKNKADWERMATQKEVLESVNPKEGRLLIFPHWLAHQVSLYSDSQNSWRYIIRGDVAYGY